MKLFIDDVRNSPDTTWTIARSSNEAIILVEANGVPDVISFDHDLGEDDTSMIFINWFIENVLDKKLHIPHNFSFIVHSANPVGRENIQSKLNSFLRFCR